MNIDRLTLGSTLCHITTYILLGLSHVYEIPYVGFLALISLAIGLLMNKMVNEELGLDRETIEYNDSDLTEYKSGDPYIAGLVGKPKENVTE